MSTMINLKDRRTVAFDCDPELLDKAEQQRQQRRDDAELTRLGKRPVMKRNFGLLSMFGFCCNVMITWELMLTVLSDSLINGGYAGTIYGFLFAWGGNVAAFCTMAELASMAPTAGGQYHWVSIMAPKRYRIMLSYLVGWLLTAGWQAMVASYCFLTAQLIQGLIALNDPSYVSKPWQTILIYWAVLIISILINTVISRLLPAVEGLTLILHVFAYVAIIFPMIYFGHHGDANTVFTKFLNLSSWETQGLSFFIGTIGPAYSLVGPDGPIHMSEEIIRPGKNIPRAMVLSLVFNGITGLGMLIAALFCIQDIDWIVRARFPLLAIFQQTIRSPPAVIGLASTIAIMYVAATFTSLASASRMIWSFARDRGTPAWPYLREIDKTSGLPTWAIVSTAIISVTLSFIALGSSVAFNDVISVAISALYTSYFIGNGLLLWRRTTGALKPYNGLSDVLTNTTGAEELTWGPWRIPEPFGTIVNALGCIFLFITLFFSFWPVEHHPTAEKMNFSSVILGSVIMFCLAYYGFRARKVFKGPVVEIYPE